MKRSISEYRVLSSLNGLKKVEHELHITHHERFGGLTISKMNKTVAWVRKRIILNNCWLTIREVAEDVKVCRKNITWKGWKKARKSEKWFLNAVMIHSKALALRYCSSHIYLFFFSKNSSSYPLLRVYFHNLAPYGPYDLFFYLPSWNHRSGDVVFQQYITLNKIRKLHYP